MKIVALLFYVCVCLGIPLGSGIYFAVRRDRTFPSFLVGVAAFVVSQLLIRIPVLQYILPKFDWFLMLPFVAGGILYLGFLALTAGIFEETARYAGFRLLRKGHTTWRDGLAFGLGHGGVEALYIGVQGLIQLPGMEISRELSLSMVISAYERCCAMAIHVGLTFVVLYGIKNRKKGFLLLAILLHGLVDFGVGIQNPVLFYAVLTGEAVLLLVWTFRSRKNWDGKSQKIKETY